MEKSIQAEKGNKECRFMPEISKQSRAIMMKSTHNKEFQKVEDRLIGYIKKNKGTLDLSKDILTSTSKSVNVKRSFRDTAKSKKEKKRGDVKVDHFEVNEPGNNHEIFSFKSFKRADQTTKDESRLEKTPELKMLESTSDTFFETKEEGAKVEQLIQSKGQILKDISNSDIRDSKNSENQINSIQSNTIDAFSNDIEQLLPKKQSLKVTKDEKNNNKLKKTSEPQAQDCSIQAKQTSKKPQPTIPVPPTIRSQLIPQIQTKSQQSSQSTTLPKSPVSKSPAPAKKPLMAQTVQPQSQVSKPSKSTLNNKYTNINNYTIDTKDIQESICGPTTSMLEKIKKINNNLRRAKGLESIIKHRDQRPDPGLALAGTEGNVFMRHLAQDQKKENTQHPSGNPFLSLLASPVQVQPN